MYIKIIKIYKFKYHKQQDLELKFLSNNKVLNHLYQETKLKFIIEKLIIIIFISLINLIVKFNK